MSKESPKTMEREMRKRIIAGAVIIFMLCALVPQSVLAATHTLTNGQTLNLTTGVLTNADNTTQTLTISDGDTISVAANAAVTITGSKNVRISCGSGVTLTLDSVTSDVGGMGSACALSFTGSGNTLIFKNTNTLKSDNQPGIRVETGTELEIRSDGVSGSDSLEATGGASSAGIGGGYWGDGGSITISGGNVTATGGYGGAGIGGGYQSRGGNITISGGKVTAAGGVASAGIGGGCEGGGGNITISGGEVTATGGYCGAGIGGGDEGGGGTITISGGEVTAAGGDYGAGIGGGYKGGGGTITISGGTVFAKRGSNATGYHHDIGNGYGGSGCTFKLTGEALVFLRYNAYVTPTAGTYRNWTFQAATNGQLYGVNLPDGWTGAGIYAVANQLTYDDNSGTGGNKTVLVPAGLTATVDNGDGVSNAGYTFLEWNTKENGEGTSYQAGDSIAMDSDITLYAIWETADSTMVGSVTPGGSGAPPSGDIVINFINSMDTATVGTVSLDGNTLTGGSWSNYGRTYTVPYSGLPYHETCTINISGFKDTYGTTMEEASHTFTTAAPAGLESLSVGTGALSPAFDADTVVYTVDAAGIDSIGITAETEDPGASLMINGAAAVSGTETTVSLDNGKNLIPVVVMSQDGTPQRSYIISVNGTVSDADLSGLSLSAGTLNFNAATTDYYLTVGSDVTAADLTAAASDGKAVMLLNGKILPQGGTKNIPLSAGDNTVTLMVIAQDATTKTYTVTISRGSSDATLSGLTLSSGTLSPAFSRTEYAYTAKVDNAVTDLTVTPTTSDSVAAVTVNGQIASTPVSLSVGSNTVTIEVTGGDGVTTKTYTVTITRREAITITNPSLPIGIVGGDYRVVMTAVGGTGSFTWSAVGLPASLALDNATGVLSGTPLDADQGTFNVTFTATDANAAEASQSYTLVIQEGCGGGAYRIVSDGDAAYTGSYTADGIPTLTVNSSVSGFTYFGVDISAVTGHAGSEVCVFVQMRGGTQCGINATKADFDTVSGATAAFNVLPDDVIEVYIVDALTNGAGSNSTVL